MKKSFKFSVLAVVSLVSVLGCSEAVDEVTNNIDCNSVCERYQSCFDSDYDVGACTDRCEAEADADEDREARLESCDACIDDRSCTDATFNCADECVGIVP